jgi:hypothetical protein
MKKITLKKVILGAGLAFLTTFSNAQNGLDSVIVERYYVSTAADIDATDNAVEGVLPAGSVTYRVFVSLKAGYNFQSLYGNPVSGGGSPLHTLLINTSTSFFNNIDRGDDNANSVGSNYLKKYNTALDSWFSVGAAAGGQMGVLKSKDNGAANLLFAHTPAGMLTNTTIAVGIPLSVQDGMVAGSPVTTTFVGDASTNATNTFGSSAQGTNSFSTYNGAISALGGAKGPSIDSNRVLIGQFTTDGVFHFELNIQIGTPSGGTQQFVAKNPINSEISIPSLIYTSPTVSLTAPATAKTGSLVAISAAVSAGTRVADSVIFFVDGVKVNTDKTSPFSYNWTATTVGTHTLTAFLGEDDGSFTAAAPITTTIVAVGTPPNVSITSPLSAAYYTTGSTVTIASSASAVGGTIDSVVFFVDGARIGKDVGSSSPYSYSWVSTTGTHTLTTVATDNNGNSATSASVVISAGSNMVPTVSITAPANAATYTVGSTITITANAADADGVVDSVVFFVDGVKIPKTKTAAPYTCTLAATVGTHTITAIATDNLLANKTSSAVIITVSPVTGISEITLNSLFTIYPNPTSDVINLEINTSRQISNVSYEVYDIIGNLILNKKLGNIGGFHNEVIDITSFVKGVYLVKISSDDSTITKRIVVN